VLNVDVTADGTTVVMAVNHEQSGVWLTRLDEAATELSARPPATELHGDAPFVWRQEPGAEVAER
jgi:hypothetical protein